MLGWIVCVVSVTSLTYPYFVAHLFGAPLLDQPRSTRDVILLRGEPLVALNLNADFDKNQLVFLSPYRRKHSWLLLYRFAGTLMAVSCSEEARGVAYTRLQKEDLIILLRASRINRGALREVPTNDRARLAE